MLEIPEAVSIVTGNQTASATRPTAEKIADGATTMASGIQAVAGIGPTTFRIGIPQYRACGNQPIVTPVMSASTVPIA